MKNPIIFLFSIILLITSHIYSQKTFIFSEKDSLTDDIILDASELQNGDFILLSSKTLIENGSIISQNIVLIKVNDKGQVTARKTINFEGYRSIANNILKIESNSFLLSGAVFIDTSSLLLFIKIDSSLNVIDNKAISISGYHPNVSNIKMVNDGNMIIYGNVSKTSSGWPNFPFLYKISENLDSIKLKTLEYHSYGSVDLLEKNDASGYYLFMVGGVTFVGNGQIFDLDTSFNIIGVDSIPKGVFNGCNSRWLPGNKFLLTGFQYPGPGVNYNIGALVLDTSYFVVHDNHFGKNDTSAIPGLHKNLDFISINNMFVGGIYSYGEWADFGAINSWFFLNQLDTTLNLGWQKYYGGDKNYAMWGLIATEDSGCMMFGATYNWEMHDYQRDIFAIKVDKHGLLLGMDNSIPERLSDIVLFPNPGTSLLYVTVFLKHVSISMCDFLGRCVFSGDLQPGINKYQTSDLSTGVYFLNIKQYGKTIYTGKWIRE